MTQLDTIRDWIEWIEASLPYPKNEGEVADWIERANDPPFELEDDEVYDRIVHNAIELSSRPITLSKTGEFGNFDSKIATPLALVITELIHNSLEHGLDISGDSLSVEVSHSESECTVIVSDNGVGLPSGFDIEGSSNLGLQIVRTLTENELKGSIKLTRVGDATQATLRFPIGKAL